MVGFIYRQNLGRSVQSRSRQRADLKRVCGALVVDAIMSSLTSKFRDVKTLYLCINGNHESVDLSTYHGDYLMEAYTYIGHKDYMEIDHLYRLDNIGRNIRKYVTEMSFDFEYYDETIFIEVDFPRKAVMTIEVSMSGDDIDDDVRRSTGITINETVSRLADKWRREDETNR